MPPATDSTQVADGPRADGMDRLSGSPILSPDDSPVGAPCRSSHQQHG
jgi:hypothetical protein